MYYLLCGPFLFPPIEAFYLIFFQRFVIVMNRKKKELWKNNELSVKCSLCKKVLHGPSGKKNCSLLSMEEFESIMNADEYLNCNCPSYTAEELPFHSLKDNDFRIQFHPHIRNANILPDHDIHSFVDKCNNIMPHENEASSDDLGNVFSGIWFEIFYNVGRVGHATIS